ncbi:hypothetical protein D3C85_1867600 [compost metagenome]
MEKGIFHLNDCLVEGLHHAIAMSKFRIYRGREALFLKHAYQFGQHIKRVIKRGLEYPVRI